MNGKGVKDSLSIVMPVYNEEEVIVEVVKNFGHILTSFENSELIAVNDCSTDGTLSILNTLRNDHAYLRIISMDRNSGHGPALMKALKEAKGDYIFHADSDNQFDANDFWLLWHKSKNENFDIVIGNREQRNDPIARLILTRFLYLFLLLVFGVRLPDSNCPFRLYTRKSLTQLLPLIPENPMIPSVLMSVASIKLSFKVGWQKIQHFPRTTSKTFLRSWKIFRLCLPAAIELLQFRSRVLPNK